MSNLEYLELAVSLINQLIDGKNTMLNYISDSKQSNGIKFKVRNYHKWIQRLNGLKTDNDFINANLDEDLILSQKFTTHLERKMIEILETKKLKDIKEDKDELAKLVKTKNKNNDDDKLDSEPIDPISTTVTKKRKTEGGGKKSLPKDAHGYQAIVTKINTMNIEGIPKQLIDQERPKDEYGGAVYDLKLVTGFGPKSADKFVSEGITLEVLLHDWNKFVEADKSNAIIMVNKIGRPATIDQSRWEAMTNEKRHSYQMDMLKQKLTVKAKYLSKLNHHQLIGIKYFYDILQRIPRKEIEFTEKFLKRVIERINKELILTVCGSFRRGKSTSGDIDSLITHPKIKTEQDFKASTLNILGTFVKQLESIGYLTDHLTDFGGTKYMGIGLYAKKFKTARRIDIRFVPYNSYGAAVLYFTGSKDFNTNMRKHAIKKGYTLNEYGLYKKEGGKKILVECTKEEDIFTKLDYPYVKPTDRNV